MKNIKRQKSKSTGVGDTVEKIFQATGVDKLAKWALGEDCGCQERKEALNRLFPYRKPECLMEDEYNYLDGFFSKRTTQVSPEVQKELLTIYNRVFNEKASTTSCPKCFLNGILQKLKIVYKEYEK
jgi:hypothetical protein